MPFTEITQNNGTGDPIKSKSPNTFVGFDRETHETHNTISDSEKNIAGQLLKDMPSGTVAHCYDYNSDPIKYGELTLTHTFIVHKKSVFVISNDDGATLHKLNSDYAKKIPKEELKFAAEALLKKKNHTKLPMHQKVYRLFQNDETGDTVSLTHSFIIIEGIIYALSGTGHAMRGGFGKVDAAVNIDTNELVAIKFSNKKVNQEFTQDEIQLTQAAGSLIGSAIKRKRSEKEVTQSVMVMPFYQYTLTTFIAAFSKTPEFFLKPTDHQIDRNAWKSRVFLTIFLKLIRAFEKLSELNMVHRDIKPDNILINFFTASGEPIILSKIEVAFSDYGFSKSIPAGETKIRSDKATGTPDFMPPEIAQVVEGETLAVKSPPPEGYCYSAQTDIYALGRTFEVAIENFSLTRSDSTLCLLIELMTNSSPEARLTDTLYIKVLLLHLLRCYSDTPADTKSSSLEDTYESKIKTPEISELIIDLMYNFNLNKRLLSPKLFSLIVALEKDLLLNNSEKLGQFLEFLKKIISKNLLKKTEDYEIFLSFYQKYNSHHEEIILALAKLGFSPNDIFGTLQPHISSLAEDFNSDDAAKNDKAKNFLNLLKNKNNIAFLKKQSDFEAVFYNYQALTKEKFKILCFVLDLTQGVFCNQNAADELLSSLLDLEKNSLSKDEPTRNKARLFSAWLENPENLDYLRGRPASKVSCYNYLLSIYKNCDNSFERLLALMKNHSKTQLLFLLATCSNAEIFSSLDDILPVLENVNEQQMSVLVSMNFNLCSTQSNNNALLKSQYIDQLREYINELKGILQLPITTSVVSASFTANMNRNPPPVEASRVTPFTAP